MDIEWALDGASGRLYIVQARPETVKSRGGNVIERYRLKQRGRFCARAAASASASAVVPRA
jgi:pyruvate,water dikinase